MSENTVHRKRYRAVILVMLASSILVSLGVWQLARLAWKQEMITTLEKKQAESPVDIADLARPYSAHEWTRVRVQGEFMADKHFMISPRTMDGRVGFHLFDTLRLTNGEIIAVNRGFVPMRSPDVTEPFDLPAAGKVTIEGVLRVPVQGRFTPDNNRARNEWYWPDLADMLRAETRPITDVYIQQAALSSSGYPVALIAAADMPNNHAQYAAFWFGMAGMCLLVFVIARKKGYA